MSQSDQEFIDLIRTTIGDQAADLVASRFNNARKYLEVIDRPEVWKTQLLSDVITAAGLVSYGKQCKGLGERIAGGAFRWNRELFEASRSIAELEQVSAAGVKDAAGLTEPTVSQDQLCALLPGVYYMDPPDGGSVTILEQLQRMSADAARYRWLTACNSGSIGIVAWHRDEDKEMVLTEAYADEAIDTAMAKGVQS